MKETTGLEHQMGKVCKRLEIFSKESFEWTLDSQINEGEYHNPGQKLPKKSFKTCSFSI